MSEEVYKRLREYFDNLPGGYPESESGAELKILKKLFSPEDAEITMKLTTMPEPLSAIAPRLDIDEKEAAEKFESLAKRGLILRMHVGDDVYYFSTSFVVGFYEFSMKYHDRELAEYVDEYFPTMAKLWENTKTQQLRVVPINSALKAASKVETYDNVRELIKDKEFFGVAECVCAQEKKLLGKPCTRHTERCVMFDFAAQYYIENDMARQITKDELMDLLKKAEENALVLELNNAKDMGVICMCCGCCCGSLGMLKMMERPADVVQSSFLAEINPDACSACGVCVERCQMDAVIEGEESYKINDGKCIGCGLCVSTCPEEAISLVDKPGALPVPENTMETLMNISKERGLI